jgi:hypothetical protein
MLSEDKMEKNRVGQMRVKKVVCINHRTVSQYVDTSDSMGQSGFEYNDITATRTIHTAVRSLKTVHGSKYSLKDFTVQ